MTLPTSLAAYPDCANLWDAAVADKAGARARVRSHDAAINLRSRMHYYRSLLRKQNATIYPPEHHLYGTSAYDHLFIQMFPDEDDHSIFWLYVTPRDATELLIEGLSDTPALLEPPTIDGEAHEVRALPPADDSTDDLAAAVDQVERDLEVTTIERRV